MGPGGRSGHRLADLPALKPRFRAAGVAAIAAILAGCASALSWDPGTYTVQAGDTLYEIAFRHSLDYRDLAAWNGLGDGSMIRPGQTLRLSPPSGGGLAASRSGSASAPATRSGSSPAATSARNTRPAAGAGKAPADWRWPTTGRVLSAFGRNPKNPNGLQIGGKAGQEIRAAAGGEVVYSGSGLIGYGQLIIVKHSEAYLSAYGHNRELSVREGQRVTAGQVIASMGEGPGKTPLLHFEIRQNGKPVDPILFLPAR
jgi:lipoprotein NlpD